MEITIAPGGNDDDDEDDVEEESENFQPACLSTTCSRIETREDLANMNMPETCTNKDCGAEVEVVKEVVASAVYLIWV